MGRSEPINNNPPPSPPAGAVIRDLGLIEIQPDAAAVKNGGGGSSAALDPGSQPPPGLLVNVNNRLVPEETPLIDGDYVVLSRDRVRI